MESMKHILSFGNKTNILFRGAVSVLLAFGSDDGNGGQSIHPKPPQVGFSVFHRKTKCNA
jgi:hypothetical protein